MGAVMAMVPGAQEQRCVQASAWNVFSRENVMYDVYLKLCMFFHVCKHQLAIRCTHILDHSIFMYFLSTWKFNYFELVTRDRNKELATYYQLRAKLKTLQTLEMNAGCVLFFFSMCYPNTNAERPMNPVMLW